MNNWAGTRETAKRVYDMRAQGRRQYEIADAVGINQSTVSVWLRNPSRFDPHIDDIALERAKAGDWDVYSNLSRWEREEFLRWLAGEIAARLAAGVNPVTDPEGSHPLQRAWGERNWFAVRKALRTLARREAAAAA